MHGSVKHQIHLLALIKVPVRFPSSSISPRSLVTTSKGSPRLPCSGTSQAIMDAARAPDSAGVIDLEVPLHNDPDEHVHYSHRAPWLRAFVLGANDGLVSVAALILGVGAGSDSLKTMQLSGIAGLVAGALSMACGEYISVSSQRDCELADIEKERQEQLKGPAARAKELEELTGIYMERGLSEGLARQVATELTEKDVIRAHARDELGIDIDELANPLQASLASAVAFAVGAAIPLLAGCFLMDPVTRNIVVAAASVVGLLILGATGAALGGAHKLLGAMRVLVGGSLAMGITYAIGLGFSKLAPDGKITPA